MDTPHCTGAPAPNGPLVPTPNASPPGGANPPAGVEAPAVNIPASQWPRCASRKATARICSRGDKEPLRPLFHNPSREPGSVIAPHNSAPARKTVSHFVHLPRECGALPSPPRRGWGGLPFSRTAIPSCPHPTRVLRDTRGLRRPLRRPPRTTCESSGTREACGGGGGSVFKEAAYQSAGEASHLRRPLIRAARRGFHA